MNTMHRREVLKLGGAALSTLLLPRQKVGAAPAGYEAAPLPASLGRVAGWGQVVRAEPSIKAARITSIARDNLLPLYAAIVGEPPWPSNPIWYQTDGGFVHSGYIQPVENWPTGEIIPEVAAPGFWAEICVPIAEARWSPSGAAGVARKLYYQTVYRVIAAVVDANEQWWYRIQEGLTWSPGPYVPASTLRRISPEALAPLAPGVPNKWMQINVTEQTLTCFHDQDAVFHTRVATGVSGTATPLGTFRILYKRHAQRMTGGSGSNRYDLPGIAFPTYFTWSGVAIHGTYWHNDYGRRHSHGCVNVPSDVAQWIFRWVDPYTPYELYTQRVEKPEESTRVVVVA